MSSFRMLFEVLNAGNKPELSPVAFNVTALNSSSDLLGAAAS
jgi:hypothetical protein